MRTRLSSSALKLQSGSVNRFIYCFFRRTMSTQIRTYKDAVDCLNSVQSNAAALEAVRASGGRASQHAIPEMLEYLHRIGYTPDDLNKLNVIHITGTKGKGSTSAFTDSILRQIKPDWKIGLYTSPHLVAVRERIRINGVPISEDEFAKFFFDVWDRLDANPERKNPNTPVKPAYFRCMTLVAFHTYLSLKVDAVILEVGVGGRYDSTNIVPKPAVTGITALGLDHILVLGRTLKEIAWQKAGIFKEAVPALTVEQPEEGMEIIKEQAVELRASELNIVRSIPELSELKLGLAGVHQIQNASLAVRLVQKFLSVRESIEPDSSLSGEYIAGLENARWPGRCQKVLDPEHSTTTWFLDGAHTVESLQCCVQWFVSPDVGLRGRNSRVRPLRVLIFNCTNGRSGAAFLKTILEKIGDQLKIHGEEESVHDFFDHVVFCTNVTYISGNFKSDLTSMSIPEADLVKLQTQRDLGNAWMSLNESFPTPAVHILPSIEHAVNVVRDLARKPLINGHLENGDHVGVNVLVAGSLHLVGGVIEVAGLSEVAL